MTEHESFVDVIPEFTAEPSLQSGEQAEAALQHALISALDREAKLRGLDAIILEAFGLDVAAVVNRLNGPRIRFLELKAFVGGRPDGIGFGSPKGSGPQVDLLWDKSKSLPRSSQSMQVLDGLIRWVLAFGLKPASTARYVIFSCADAQAAAMGGVRPGKQNNLRIKHLERNLLTWSELVAHCSKFLLD